MKHVDIFKKYILSDMFCMFFYIFTLSINHFSMYYFNKYLKWLFLISYLWVGVVYCYNTFFTRKYTDHSIFKIAQVFLIINIFTTFIRPVNHRISVLQDFAQLILYFFVSFGSFYNPERLDSNKKQFRLMILLFVVFTFVISSASVLAIQANSPLISIQEGYAENRARGFYYETNEGGLNAYASIIFGFYIFKIFEKMTTIKAQILKTVCIINVPVQLLLIKANGSRTSLLYLIFAVVMILFILLKKKVDNGLPKPIVGIIAVAVLIMIFLLVCTPYGFERNLYYFIKDVPSWKMLDQTDKIEILNRITSGRYLLWQTSIDEIVKSPWIGYGLKSGNFAYHVYNNFSNSHNLIINTLLFSGILGLIVLFLYLLCWFRNAVNIAAESCDWIILVFVVSFIGCSMLEMTFLYNGKTITAICWSAMGYLMDCRSEKS